MSKNIYPKDETVTIDRCECVYCGHFFSGRDACNGDMDRMFIECPSCKKGMSVYLSIEYICMPLEEDEL